MFATGSAEFLGQHIVNAGLDHGFYMHANDGVVIDGNIGWGIASWGIHLYGGGHGANKSLITRNIMLGCRSGGCLITGHGSVIANNLFTNSTTGINIFRQPSPNNTFVNNLALWNQNDADVDDMGGKCYHPRSQWPQCGPFNNTGKHNGYSKAPTHCTEATQGKCTHTGTGCCTSGFPSGASDLLANGSWNTVLTQWDEGQEIILDGRLCAGSPALGRAVPVQMPDGGLIPWLPSVVGFDLGPFQSASQLKTDDASAHHMFGEHTPCHSIGGLKTDDASTSTTRKLRPISTTKKRRVSYWFGPWATAPCPLLRPPAPLPPTPPAPPGCLPDCSWSPCMTCITGCPDPGGTPSGTDGHGCNISGYANTCNCNAMGGRPASNCSKSSRGFKLCPGLPPTNECRHNATYALAALKQEGGSNVATSMFLYCGHTINATGDLSAPRWAPEGAQASSLLLNVGCVEMAGGLTTLGIGSEPVIGASLPALRAMFASPDPSIKSISELVRTEKLAGVSWDVEPANSTTEDATKFAAYLSSLRVALAPLGARVTVYSNAFSPIIENVTLLSTSIDRVLTGQTYNGGLNGQVGAGMTGWLANYEKLLAPGVNRASVAPAMLASSLRGTWNCMNSSIEQRYNRIVADGLEEIAIYTFDPTSWLTLDGAKSFTDCSNSWLPFLRRFLATNKGGRQ